MSSAPAGFAVPGVARRFSRSRSQWAQRCLSLLFPTKLGVGGRLPRVPGGQPGRAKFSAAGHSLSAPAVCHAERRDDGVSAAAVWPGLSGGRLHRADARATTRGSLDYVVADIGRAA
jgi:hypothetical protein